MFYYHNASVKTELAPCMVLRKGSPRKGLRHVLAKSSKAFPANCATVAGQGQKACTSVRSLLGRMAKSGRRQQLFSTELYLKDTKS